MHFTYFQISDGCLSHRTAVGAAALGQYLKYIIEPGDENYQSNVNIHGTNYLLYEVWKDVLHQDDKVRFILLVTQMRKVSFFLPSSF